MLSYKDFNRLLQVIPHNELYLSPINGLFIRHSDTPFHYESVIQEPSICVVLKGERIIQIGEQCYQFDNRHFMFCPVNIPTRGEIRQATQADPFLVVSMRLDLTMINKILLEQHSIPMSDKQNSEPFGQWLLNDELENAFTRLLLLHENPKDIYFLAPLIQQEIYYRLLTGEQGEKLKQMVNFGSHIQKVAKATDYLREHFTENVALETLADLCGMSLSGFHSHFKKITTMSPLQYQKSLRLMESKRLISQEKMPIANVAFQVGYESPSQFSREYKRYFGVSPSGDLHYV